MADETDVIQHLIAIEKEAAAVLQSAQSEVDSRIAAARAKADADFKSQYSVMYADLEAAANERISRAQRQHDEALSAYRESLGSTPKNTAAFGALMDSLLFK